MTHTTPTEIHEGISRLCQKIGAKSSPVFVPVVPDPLAKPQFCFPNVTEKVAREGGGAVYGWCIWDSPTFLVEGEFHAIWKSPGGVFQCVSPHTDGERTLLFLPDKRQQYRGVPVPNVRFSWPKDDETDRYIRVLEAVEEFRFLHAVPWQNRQNYSQKDTAILMALAEAQNKALQQLMEYRAARGL